MRYDYTITISPIYPRPIFRVTQILSLPYRFSNKFTEEFVVLKQIKRYVSFVEHNFWKYVQAIETPIDIQWKVYVIHRCAHQLISVISTNWRAFVCYKQMVLPIHVMCIRNAWTCNEIFKTGPTFQELTHWSWVMHIYVNKLTNIGWDIDLSPDWHRAIIWTNEGVLLIRNSVIVSKIRTFSFKKCIWKCRLRHAGSFVLASMC